MKAYHLTVSSIVTFDATLTDCWPYVLVNYKEAGPVIVNISWMSDTYRATCNGSVATSYQWYNAAWKAYCLTFDIPYEDIAIE